MIDKIIAAGVTTAVIAGLGATALNVTADIAKTASTHAKKNVKKAVMKRKLDKNYQNMIWG